MKKILSFAAIALGVLTFASCEKNILIPVDPEVFFITVNQVDWKLTDWEDNNAYVAVKNVPEITEDVFDNGLVKVYRVYDYDKRDAYQIEMPYVRERQEWIGVDDPTDPDFPGFYWNFSESVTYEMGIGAINFVYRASDFYYGDLPEPMQFRVVIVR